MPALKRLGLVLVWVLSVSLVAWAQTKTGGGVEAISAALRARNFADAAARSREALKQTPNDPQLWTLNGLALVGVGKRTEALQSFQHALKIDPNYLSALEGAGQVHYEAGSRKAVPLLNRILQLRPDDPTAHAMLAVLEYRDGNCKAAVAHFDKASALIDSQVDALLAQATCLVRLQQMEPAIRVFQRTVALDPANPRHRKLLAAVQLMAEQPQEALATPAPLAPSAENSHADAEALSLISTAAEKAGDTPRAVATLRQAILLAPKNIDLYLDYANIAFAHQSFQVGVEILSDGIGLQPTAAPLYVARGVLYVQMADYDKPKPTLPRPASWIRTRL